MCYGLVHRPDVDRRPGAVPALEQSNVVRIRTSFSEGRLGHGEPERGRPDLIFGDGEVGYRVALSGWKRRSGRRRTTGHPEVAIAVLVESEREVADRDAGRPDRAVLDRGRDRIGLGGYDDETGILTCSSTPTTSRPASGPSSSTKPTARRHSRSSRARSPTPEGRSEIQTVLDHRSYSG